jgi:hypothetical protein
MRWKDDERWKDNLVVSFTQEGAEHVLRKAKERHRKKKERIERNGKAKKVKNKEVNDEEGKGIFSNRQGGRQAGKK